MKVNPPPPGLNSGAATLSGLAAEGARTWVGTGIVTAGTGTGIVGTGTGTGTGIEGMYDVPNTNGFASGLSASVLAIEDVNAAFATDWCSRSAPLWNWSEPSREWASAGSWYEK